MPMGQVVTEKLFGTICTYYIQADRQTDGSTWHCKKNPAYPNFPFRDVSLTRTHLSTGRQYRLTRNHKLAFARSLHEWKECPLPAPASAPAHFRRPTSAFLANITSGTSRFIIRAGAARAGINIDRKICSYIFWEKKNTSKMCILYAYINGTCLQFPGPGRPGSAPANF